MNFLKQHILFPARFGFIPYFWLVFLFPVVIQLFSLDTSIKWLFFILLVIFLKAYRDGYEVQKYLSVDIVIQSIVACLFGIFQYNSYLFIFTALEIGFLPITKRIFYKYLTIYYLCSAVSLASVLLTTRIRDGAFFVGISIAFIMALSTPLAAKALSESNRKIYRLDKQNRRLETIIRQNERERIARDLHDNLGQAFSIITLKSELAEKLLDHDLKQTKNELKDIADTSRKNLTLVRSIVANLQERTLAETMLEEEKNLQIANILLLSSGELETEIWPIDIQNTLSAVIKEAVTNIIRHSQATLTEIHFSESHINYLTTIKDNGKGFHVIKEGTYGLSGMRTRVTAKKGTIQINSRQGTMITITFSKE
ncbi:sensor histidine kinase [Melissococcus plutonius]|uniref:sensor histidine kinase n=1 Tax=Melissococcus plutonius TaxID=33970 RepID=UPI003EE8073C